MSSPAVTIADAVVALLNAAPADTFSETFTARRRFVPTFGLEQDKTRPPPSRDLSALRVEVVVPPVREMVRVDRGDWESRYPVALACVKRLETGTDDDARETEMATLVAVVTEITDYLRANAELSNSAALASIEPHQIFDPEMFSANHELFAQATLYYLLYD